MVERYNSLNQYYLKNNYYNVLFFIHVANELLVRTILSYCSVHGSQGGGLASVRMELILLLQELQQDRRFTTGTSYISSNGTVCVNIFRYCLKEVQNQLQI
jgi:hypothetical protein